MAQVIATNTLSLLTQNALDRSKKSQSQAIERLSTGKRINSARDDAAGLAIADRMTSQLEGLQQANRNANDGTAMAQTAESALGSVTDNLHRIRDLVVQGLNGTYTTEDRKSINAEIESRLAEIDRVGRDTTFNSKQLLGNADVAGSDYTKMTDEQATTTLQVGAFDGQTIDLKLIDVRDMAIKLKGGSLTDTPDQVVNGGDIIVGNHVTPGNKLIDKDGNMMSGALKLIDDQVALIDNTRASLGAQQNRLESAVNSNAVTTTNLAAARSQITDADYAAEVSSMSTAQILQQAGQNVLAQANQIPQNVLSLLKG